MGKSKWHAHPLKKKEIAGALGVGLTSVLEGLVRFR